MRDFMPSQIEARAEFWEQRRRAASTDDRLLTGDTKLWLQSLPEPLQPRALAAQYPRVANALPPVWGERGRALVLLEQLLVDDRDGTRLGFPDEVQAELRALLAHRTHSPT